MSIPKKIFYVWGANEPKNTGVEFCINSWYRIMPEYEIIEINENSKDYFNFQDELKKNKWFQEVYKRKMYAYISDYVRIKTLYENGGIYLDTDVTVLQKFDDLLNEPAFVGLQTDKPIPNDIVEPAILGAQKGNKFLEQILFFYEKDIWNLPLYRMPQIFEYFIKENFGNFQNKSRDKQEIIRYETLSIYPEKYFIPFRYNEKFNTKCLTKETHSIHWFNASWMKPEILFFLNNKHKISLEEIDSEYLVYNKSTSKNSFLENVFSVKNTNDKSDKVVTILGQKYKFSRRDKNND